MAEHSRTKGGGERFDNVSARMSRTLGAADRATLGVAVLAVLEDLAAWVAADCAFVSLVDESGRVTDEWHWCRPDVDVVAPVVGARLGDTFGSALAFLEVGQSVAVDDLDQVELSPGERRLAKRNDLRALAIAPVRIAGAFIGVVGLMVFGRPHTWEPYVIGRVELVASVLVQTVVRTHQRGAIEQANARARRIARYVPSPLVMLDRARRVTWVSPSFATATGRAADDVVGRFVSALFDPEDAALLARLPTPGSVLARLLLADRTWRWTELSWQTIDDEDSGGAQDDETVLELRDIHDRQLQAEELRRDVDHDSLTGLLNRSGLARRLAVLAEERRTTITAFCDLNGFKRWNDRHGHAAGDALLRSVAAMLTATVRPGDLVARLGGDEFVIIVVDPTVQDRQGLEARLQAAVTGLSTLEGGGQVTAAVGVSEPGPASEAPRQRVDADEAMYRHKRAQAGR